MLVIDTPTTCRLVGYEGRETELNRILTYRDKKVEYEYNKLRKNFRMAQYMGEDAWNDRVAELKASIVKSLVFTDEQGLWTYSGLADRIANAFGDTVENKVDYPEPKLIPWATPLKFAPRQFQLDARDNLLTANHGGVEIGTGLGKSFILKLLTKHFGLKTLVVTPSKSIAGQIYKDFLKSFGKKYVGKFFGGKKESNKLFVVAVDKSLSLVEKGDEHWKALSATKVFIADESHLCPATTLASVCFGLAALAPYRFFFSGTQMRNDGCDLLLEAITSKIVYEKTVREGVDENFLAKPIFRMVTCQSKTDFESNDANEMTRAHLYYNPRTNAIAGAIANGAIAKGRGPVLILVEEVEQITYLLPFLKHEVGFAHGGLTKENKPKVPPQFHDSDPDALVARFNEGKLPILVGTSCVSTGTDIQRNKTTIYLQGGKSEIQIRQGPIGRSTRLHEESGKVDCDIWDFDVANVSTLHRHADARAKIYEDVYDPAQYIEL